MINFNVKNMDSYAHLLESQYSLGDVVYLKTDPDGFARIVTAITIREGALIYGLSFADIGETWHNAIEISKNKPIP